MNLNYFVFFFCSVISCMLNVSLSSSDHGSSNGLSRISRQAKTGPCTLPEYPENGYWTIGRPGEQVGVNTSLKFMCDDGYTLTSRTASLICTENGWNMAIPQCVVRQCTTLLGTENMKVECYSKENDKVPCSAAVDGTRAVFQCAHYYETSDKNNKRICSEGSWDYPPPRCAPVCGIKPLTAEPLSNNGENVATGESPWVVAVYSKQEGKNFTYIGVGTMLSERIILTVAHVVSNYLGMVQPSHKYKIGVGKRYVGFNDDRDLHAQYANIDKIILHPKYKGEIQAYSSDIAFLITQTKLILSKWVQPACITGLDSMTLSPNTLGAVAGWGLSAGKLSDTVQNANVLFKDYPTCMQELPNDWASKYLTYDKFCAGSSAGGSIGCKGFSGSGFIVEKSRRYFVYGISSLGRSDRNEVCYIEQHTLYTSVAAHYNWIADILNEYSD